MATPLTTSSDWLAANPPAAEHLTETLAGVSARIRGGEDFSHAVREFLDEFSLRGDDRSRAGAAIALAFDERRSTRDIDAVCHLRSSLGVRRPRSQPDL